MSASVTGRACLGRATSSIACTSRVLGIARPLPSRPAGTRVIARAGGFEGYVDSAFSQLAVLADTANAVAQNPGMMEAADKVAEKTTDNGLLGFLAGPLEGALNGIEGVLEAVHVPYAYGFAIITLTVAVKVITWPLSQKQVESTLALQVLQPKVKELQAKYGGNQEQLQLETARLYREAEVNPLAGCLPTLVTLPVWIGLYRALTNAAEQGLLKEGFFWIPTLSGPVSMSENQSGAGLSWLFPFVDGAPPIGWNVAGAYLILPVLLVVSQYASQKIISPQQQTEDPTQKQVQTILNALPLMLGWFSLNVPSGLTLYWFVNNILTTAQQVILRATLKPRIETELTAKIQAIEARNKPVVLSEEERRAKEARKGGSGKGKEMGARKKKGDKFRARQAASKAREAVAESAQVAKASEGKENQGEGKKENQGEGKKEDGVKEEASVAVRSSKDE